MGEFSGKRVNGTGAGVGVLDFGHGDTLTYEWQVEIDQATGLLLGTWVVAGGTGRLVGACGNGISIATIAADGRGEFEYLGTLSY